MGEGLGGSSVFVGVIVVVVFLLGRVGSWGGDFRVVRFFGDFWFWD